MTVDRTTCQQHHWSFIRSVWVQELVADIPRSELIPTPRRRSSLVAATNQNLWRGQFIGHRQPVRRVNAAVIGRPDSGCQTDLLQVVNALNGERLDIGVLLLS